MFATDVVHSAGNSQQIRELRAVLLSYDGAILAGHVMLDLLEENGYGPLDVDLLVTDSDNLPLTLAIQHAAASRGLAYDVVTINDGQPLGPDTTGRTAVAITLLSDENPIMPQIAVEAHAALVGNELAVYEPQTLQGEDTHE